MRVGVRARVSVSYNNFVFTRCTGQRYCVSITEATQGEFQTCVVHATHTWMLIHTGSTVRLIDKHFTSV